MEKQIIKIGYMDTHKSKIMKPLTSESLDSLLTSPQMCETMAKLVAETDPEKKTQWKHQLPVVIYGCLMPENGVRPTRNNGLAVASGFCMHDWDHMPVSPGSFYYSQIAGREEELRIVMAHITPRGEGLRLVTLLADGEGIADCQARLAALFGMEQYADRSVKDINRVSFLPGKDYMLYINKKGLFEQPYVERAAVPSTPQTLQTPQTPQTSQTPQTLQTPQTPQTLQTPQTIQNVAESFAYSGIRYSSIIEALIKRLATNGMATEGERNNTLFALVRELRHVCDYNFQTVYMLVAPYFATLPDAEIRSTIGSAISTNGRTITPMMRGVLSELRNANVDVSEETEGLALPKLPKVSPIEEMILSHYPRHLRSQVFLAMLPIWGVYGTHVRFDFLDGRENSLSFMTAVVGKSGSGKAFAAHLFDQMTRRFRIEDALERQKADEYLAQCNKASDDAEKPDDPRPRVRIYGDDITTSQLLEYLDNLKGEHGIQFTEEVARLQKAKRTIYGDNDDLYCKAFDNGVGGKESKSKQTRNIRIPIYLNGVFCGTPGAMHKFFNNPEGGLNNRIIYAFMPKVRIKGFPVYQRFSEADQGLFDQVTEQLWQAGHDGQKVTLPWLERDIMLIKGKWDKEDDENPDEVWYDLGKRSLVSAMRVGVLQWLLRGCPTDEKQLREIGRVVRWMADAMRLGIYAFCGQDYEDINEADNAHQLNQGRMGKNKKLYSLLPQAFTTQDLITLRIQNGASANVAMVLSRWIAGNLVRKVGDGRYEKVAA